jgi:predicted esterase YcpF (UPF0227 family)
MSHNTFSWAKFLQDQGRASAQLEQLRHDVKSLQAKVDAMVKSQEETKVLVGSFRGAYKTIAVTATIVGAIATLAARWWVAMNSGG